MITLIFVVSLFTIFYYLIQRNQQYWEKRGIPGPKPTLFFGNLSKTFLLKAQVGEIFTEIYRKYDQEPVVGIFKAFTPALLIRDPDLIKEITTKSFSHFHDNDIDVDKKIEPLFGRNPFCLKGEEWRIARLQLSPGFSSGKMKWLYPYLETNSQKMVKFLESEPSAINGQGYEANELCSRFTLNNVGDSVYGIEAKCFEEENSEFRQLAANFLTPGSWAVLLIAISGIFPDIKKIVPIKFTPKFVGEKLTNLVTEAVRYREENNIVRNDFLHIISQLKKTCKDYEFTDVDVAAHVSGFFVDGYMTSAMVMSSLLFQISGNPEKQSILREEINKAFEENDNKMPYEALQSLTYLDAVVNESLRLLPPTFALQKVCTKTFTYIPKGSKKPVVIEKDTPIILPTYALQTDPQYFENPDEFKPERFLGSNKDNIRKYTFMPFGEGPRACLGQRFGTLQIKVGVSYLIRNFELKLNKKTQVPLKFDPKNFLVVPVGGLWLDFKKINRS